MSNIQRMYKNNKDKPADHGYNTPKYIFKYLDDNFHFEIDPCGTPDNYLGTKYCFTEDDNGLEQEWNRPTFVNPPYGYGNESIWLNKCITEHDKHKQPIFILLPSKTESSWFYKAYFESSVIIFPQGRINFIKNGTYKYGNIIGSVIFGFVNISSPEYYQFQFKHIQSKDMTNIIDNGFNCIFFPTTKQLKNAC